MALVDRYDAFLLDLDGTLYRADHATPGAPEVLETIRAQGGRPCFMTNNSSATPEQVAGKLMALGILAASDEVETSALATADLLASRGGGSAFVIGEQGVRSALVAGGLELLDGAPARTDYVVVGWDRRVDYEKLRSASLLVQRGAHLVATNADRSYPAPDGLWPGAGALLAVITETTGAVPEIVGKPNPPLYRAALRRAGGGRPLVIGDRLETDIAGAGALGWDSLLVLTGVTSASEVETSSVRPTFIGADLSALLAEPPPAPLSGKA